jgi:hypothetical protein
MKIKIITGTSLKNIDLFVNNYIKSINISKLDYYHGYPETHKHPREFKKDIDVALSNLCEGEYILFTTLNKMVINIVIDYMQENDIDIENFELIFLEGNIDNSLFLDDDYCFKNCKIGFMDY